MSKVLLLLFCDKYYDSYYGTSYNQIYFIFDKINSIDHPVEITRRHSMVFPFLCHEYGFFLCVTDVGSGGWRNK